MSRYSASRDILYSTPPGEPDEDGPGVASDPESEADADEAATADD